MPKPKAIWRLAGYVKAVGVGEGVAVAVGRAHHLQHVVAFAQLRAAVLIIFAQAARVALQGAFVAQHFFDGGRQPAGVGAQAFQLAGVAQQRVEAAGDQVCGGLVAGDEQRGAGGQQFGRGEAVALHLGADEMAQQVIARGAAALGQQRRQKLAQRQQMRLRLVEYGGGDKAGALKGQHPV
jgi:hypothetical protein